MKAHQAYYTCCHRGLSGRSGYQIRALSADVEADEQREVEQRSFYRAPPDAPPEPGPEDPYVFPRDYRFGRLECGRPAITSTSYVGQDYSGRWGNFFSHTLILAEEPTMWPIDYYEWEGWRFRLRPEEEEEEPEPLPAADLTEVEEAESFTFEELSEFLQEEPGRPSVLAAMIRAVILARRDERPLVVRETTQIQGLYWLACVQKAFPLPHAFDLSFASYQFEPSGCNDLNVTVPGSGFAFDRDDREYRFYIFDLTSSSLSDVPERADDFAALVAVWMTEEPARLERFHEFMGTFNHRLIDEELNSAVHLFELLHEGRLYGDSLPDMLAFVARFVIPEHRVRVLTKLAQICVTGFEELDTEAMVVRFLIDSACEVGELRLLAVEAWRKLFERWAKVDDEGFASVRDTWRHLAERLGAHGREISGELLSVGCLADDAGLPRRVKLFLLRRTVGWLRDLERRPLAAQPEVKRLVRALAATHEDVPELFDEVLGAVGVDDAQAVAGMCALIVVNASEGLNVEAARTLQAVLGEALAGFLRRRPATFAMEVRLSLARGGSLEAHTELLLAEGRATIRSTGDPVGFFEAYRSQIANALPGYWKRCVDDLVEGVRASLSSGERKRQARRWLEDGLIPELTHLGGVLLAEVNTQIPINPEEERSEAAALKLGETARRLGVELMPDRPHIRDLLQRFATGNTWLEAEDWRPLAGVPQLILSEYRFFVDAFLPQALEGIDSSEEHGRLLSHLCGQRKPDQMAAPYMVWLTQKRTEPWPTHLEAALLCWLSGPNGQLDPALEPLKGEVLDALTHRIRRLKKKTYADLDQRMQLRPTARHAWNALRGDIEPRRGLGRLLAGRRKGK